MYMTRFLYALAAKHSGRFAAMVVLALLGVLILLSSTPLASSTSRLHAGDLLD